MVEDDYRDTLSPKDKEWLDKFNEVWAGDNPQLLYRDKKTKRELWRQTQKVRRDAMARIAYGLDSDPPASGNQEDAIISLLDQHVQPPGNVLRERARVRKEAREAEERAQREQEEATKARRRGAR